MVLTSYFCWQKSAGDSSHTIVSTSKFAFPTQIDNSLSDLPKIGKKIRVSIFVSTGFGNDTYGNLNSIPWNSSFLDFRIDRFSNRFSITQGYDLVRNISRSKKQCRLAEKPEPFTRVACRVRFFRSRISIDPKSANCLFSTKIQSIQFNPDIKTEDRS